MVPTTSYNSYYETSKTNLKAFTILIVSLNSIFRKKHAQGLLMSLNTLFLFYLLKGQPKYFYDKEKFGPLWHSTPDLKRKLSGCQL